MILLTMVENRCKGTFIISLSLDNVLQTYWERKKL